MYTTTIGLKHAQTSPTEELGNRLLDLLLPSFLNDLLVPVLSGVSFVTLIIILMMLSVILVKTVIQTAKSILTRLNREQIRSEFSTIFERVWRWLPFTKSTLEEYREIECSFEELEEEFQEEHR